MKKRIFSGIQPSGNLHIGNYIGAISNWIKLQDDFECIFCVVDMHAITVPQDPDSLRRKTLDIAKIYLAAGIDPGKSTLFIQSHIPEHAELAWILNTISRMSDLFRMTQFKDKSGLQIDITPDNNGEAIQEAISQINKVGVGLFDYPVLMAADILLYDTEVVPVGKGQLQHIELARDLAKRFNNQFGDSFKIPQGYTTKETMMVMGLDNPDKKMSKSAKSEYNYISLTDSEETIRKKIKKAVTDSGSEIVYSDDKPALKNLVNIYSVFSGQTPKEIEKHFAGKGYGQFKDELANVIIAFLAPFQARYRAISDEDVLEILREGARRAKSIAEKRIAAVKEKVGFII